MNADRLLVGLDAAQRRAVQSEAAPLAIVASAGSGKTTVLTRRIAHRIELGQAEPRHIVALTFTRDAAGELRRRLRRLEIHESIEAGTFHSIALRLLRDRALTLNESMPSLAPDRLRLVRECLKELRLELDPYPAMTDIDWARARRIEPRDYDRQSRAARRRGAVPSGRFIDLAAAYERLKTTAWGGRLRRPVGPQPARRRNRRGIPQPGSLAIPSLLRRRGAGPQPAAARVARGMARWASRHLSGRRSAPGDLWMEWFRPHDDDRGRTGLSRRHGHLVDHQLPLLASGGQRRRRRVERKRPSRRHGQQSAGRDPAAHRVVSQRGGRGRQRSWPTSAHRCISTTQQVSRSWPGRTIN